jgi:hypothetical protein
MRGERLLLRVGEYLVGRACQRLPPKIREERYREWAAELPAILHDPQVRPAPRRAARMLGYAADTLRGALMTTVRGRRRTPRLTALLSLLLVGALVSVAGTIWTTVRAPGHALHYAQLTWSLLLVAFPISMVARSATRVTVLISISGLLAGVAVNLWKRAGSGGLGELLFGGVVPTRAPGFVARRPVGPRQAGLKELSGLWGPPSRRGGTSRLAGWSR